MEISEGLAQQQRLQAIAEKRERLTEIENRKRQLEDDRRQLQHLKSKALRERWLLDGAPSGTPEQDEAKKKLQEDEDKTKDLEEAIFRMEQELEELETGVKPSSTKDSLSGGPTDDEFHITVDGKVPGGSVKVVHEVNGENGVHLLSSTEVDELIHKADEISMVSTTEPVSSSPQVLVSEPETTAAAAAPPSLEITGLEAKPPSGLGDNASPEAAGSDSAGGVPEASSNNPVTMTFMGYQNVEDEAETRKVLGLEGTVKAELVVIEDGEASKASPTCSNTSVVVSVSEEASAKEEEKAAEEEEQTAPPNGSAAVAATTTETAPVASDAVKPGEEAPPTGEAGEKQGEPQEGSAAPDVNKEKQPCKCCTIM